MKVIDWAIQRQSLNINKELLFEYIVTAEQGVYIRFLTAKNIIHKIQSIKYHFDSIENIIVE